jgi:small subunit ribosomal protein S3Ae
MFGEGQLAETPAIDPKAVAGRTVESNVAELTGQPNKYYMNMKFRVDRVEDGRAYTRFHGYSCAKEHLFRVVRKRSQKVRAVSDVETKDGWKLHIVSLVILNRNTDVEVQRKVRKLVVSELAEKVRDMDISSLMRSITGGVLQKDIRKMGNRIYPIRFSEVESIEVSKAGVEPDAAAVSEGEEAGPIKAEAGPDAKAGAGEKAEASPKPEQPKPKPGPEASRDKAAGTPGPKNPEPASGKGKEPEGAEG